MKKRDIIIILAVLAGVFLLLSIVFGFTGHDKISSYYNSDTYYSLNKNAYVGGDAYNYIINGTYFAGYSALCGACLICANISGIAALSFYSLMKKEEQEREQISELQDPPIKADESTDTMSVTVEKNIPESMETE